MAEYVRRKRPPASHPYWARLHDRTHPPCGRGLAIFFGILGLLCGMYYGNEPAITLHDAVRAMAHWSIYIAMIGGLFGLLAGISERDRQQPLISLCICLLWAFFIAFFGYMLGLMFFGCCHLLIRWPTSGLGFLYGSLTGAGIGVAVARIITWLKRRTWWQRQENWPKWEEMARGHRRQEYIITPPDATPETPHLPAGMV